MRKKYEFIILFLFVLILSSCTKPPIVLNIEEVDTIPTIEVTRNISVDEVTLPETVGVVYDDGSRGTVGIIWDDLESIYLYDSFPLTLEGTLQLLEQSSNTNNFIVTQDIILVPIDITETVRSIGELSFFYEALVAIDRLDVFVSDENITVFAPTNVAFETLWRALEMTKEDFLQYDLLEDILLNHIVVGAYPSSILRATSPITLFSFEGSDITITLHGNDLFVNEVSELTTTDVLVTGGSLHLVDTVIMPNEPITLKDFNITQAELMQVFIGILRDNGLFSEILFGADMTFFMPDPETFMDLLLEYNISANTLLDSPVFSDIVLNHIVRGEYVEVALFANAPFELQTLSGNTITIRVNDLQLMVNDATVLSIQAVDRLGLLYVIDQVILTDAMKTTLQNLPKEVEE